MSLRATRSIDQSPGLGHRQRCVYTHIASCSSSASFSEALNRASASSRPASSATGDTQDITIDIEVRIAWFIRATRTCAAATLTSLNCSRNLKGQQGCFQTEGAFKRKSFFVARGKRETLSRRATSVFLVVLVFRESF